jgi:ABC-type Zn uptake system ZnuABC Zn-binding protein ZnuA
MPLCFPGNSAVGDLPFPGDQRRGEKVVRDRMRYLIMTATVFLLPLPQDAAAAMRVVASVFPVADMVRQVAGREAEVLELLPPGANPHVFEPAPGALREVAQGRIFFRVGAGLESWSEKIVRSAAPADMTVVDLSEGIPLIRRLGAGEAENRIFAAATGLDRSAEGEGANPHFWLDPLLAREMVDRIETALIAALPESKTSLSRRAARFREELQGLDEEIRRRVTQFESHRLVSFHDAWSYFARRYGLEEVGVIEVAPGREPSPRHLAGIVSRIRRLGVRAVFAESQFPPQAAEVIARETGVKLLILDPIGGAAPDRRSYLDLMRYNLDILEEGLGRM